MAKDEMERIAARLRQASGRSPAYRWFRRNHAWFAALLDETKPAWAEVAVTLAEEAGLRDKDGQPLRPETLRHAWWRVERDMRDEAKRPKAAPRSAPARERAEPLVRPVEPEVGPAEPKDFGGPSKMRPPPKQPDEE